MWAPQKLLLATSLVLLLTKCQPATSTCHSSTDCGDDQVCAQGVCRDSCQRESDCNSGRCIHNTCLPVGRICQQHFDCLDIERCVSGRCHLVCTARGDCLHNQACVSGTCQTVTVADSGHMDIQQVDAKDAQPDGHIADTGPGGDVTAEDAWRPDVLACQGEGDCPDDNNLCNGRYICVDQRCLLDESSVVICDHESDTFCSQNTCVPATGQCLPTAINQAATCRPDDACAINYTCQEGLCLGQLIAPEIPRLLAPPNGAYTGSPHAPPERNTLRPLFRWSDQGERECEAVTYHLQISPNCTAGSYQSCDFENIVYDRRLLQSTFRTENAMTVVAGSGGGAVGMRYAWRVKACRGEACSPWSTVFYLNLGRVPSDLNGDGYSDVAIGAADFWSSASDGAFVYHGSASGLQTTPTEYPGTHLGGYGTGVAACDMDGDGYAELFVGAPTSREVHLFRGASQELIHHSSTQRPLSRFGANIACVGDLNADGFADAAVAGVWSDGSGIGSVTIFYGDADIAQVLAAGVDLSNPIDDTIETEFGLALAAAGDLNNDGYSELAVGAPYQRVGPVNFQGMAFVFPGGPLGVRGTDYVPLGSPYPVSAYFGIALSGAVDLNHDGYRDFLVGARSIPGNSGGAGAYFTYSGSHSGIQNEAIATVLNPEDQTSQFGSSLAVLQNDSGLWQVIVGAPGWQGSTGTFGAILVLQGASQTLSHTVVGPETSGNPRFGTTVANIGDVNGDGWPDIAAGGTEVESVFVFQTTIQGMPQSASQVLLTPNSDDYANFGRSITVANW